MTEHRVFHSMGIPVHITMVGVSSEQADDVLKKAECVFNEYDLRFSRFKPESELMGLNTSNGAWHKVSVELFQVLKRCVALAAETDGAFDPSVGGILASYGYGLPEHFTMRTPQPTYRDLAFNDRELLVRLAPGQILEPACIVKGMAIDMAVKAILEIIDVRTQGFMINAGGDILTKGAFEDGKSWNIAIQDPRSTGAIVAALGIQNAGVATSGTYQTYGDQDGKKWHHLVNMKTMQSPSEIISATVVAETCERADTEASLAILLTKNEGMDRLGSLGLPYFLMFNDGTVTKNNAFEALEIPISTLVS
ncbi:MAG: FAD:protein FMN transferase [Minisyncoccia bacterium]